MFLIKSNFKKKTYVIDAGGVASGSGALSSRAGIRPETCQVPFRLLVNNSKVIFDASLGGAFFLRVLTVDGELIGRSEALVPLLGQENQTHLGQATLVDAS